MTDGAEMSEQRHYADPRVGGECPACEGHGWMAHDSFTDCRRCLGSGRVGVLARCEICGGRGRRLDRGANREHPCGSCSGRGYIEREPEIELVQGWPLAEGEC